MVKSGDNVFIHGASATPGAADRRALAPAATWRTSPSTTCTLTGHAPFGEPECQAGIRSVSLFTGAHCASRSPRAAPTSCRSSSRTSRGCSARARCRSTWRCCSSRRPTATATARSAPRVDAALAAADRGQDGARGDQRADAAHARALGGAAVAGCDAFIATDRPLVTAPPALAAARSSRASASSSPTWSRTAPACRWASAPSPTRCWRGWATSTSWACTPRCSPTG